MATSIFCGLFVTLTSMVTFTVQLTVHEASQLSICNGVCTCGSEYIPGQKVMLGVTCGHRDPVSQIPDWSDLARIQANISINLNLKNFPQLLTLRREDFPVGLPVKVVRLNDLPRSVNVTRDVFENVRYSLTVVSLSGHVDGPLMFLANLPRLESLLLNVGASKDWIEGNGSVVLSQGLFQGVGLQNLKLLELFGQRVVEIAPVAFDGLGVERIQLYLSKLREFPASALRRIANLKVLFVNDNEITHLKNGALDGMGLEQLDFPYSRLTRIDPEALVGVKDSLKQLYVRGGNLDALPATALSPLKLLEACSFVDMESDGVVNVSRSFKGEYCLKKLFVSFKDLEIQPDAFEGQESCIEELYLKSSSLRRVPTEALATLQKIRVLELQSSSLTTFPAEAFSGFHGKRIVIDAPLTHVEPGAFRGSVHYPLVLHLENAMLKGLDFFFDYPANTFSSIGLGNTTIPCDCALGKVNLNLGKYNYTVGGYLVPGYVSGECLLQGSQMGTYLPEVRDIFSRCKNVTVVDPNVGPTTGKGRTNGCGFVTFTSVLLVVFISLGVTSF